MAVPDGPARGQQPLSVDGFADLGSKHRAKMPAAAKTSAQRHFTVPRRPWAARLDPAFRATADGTPTT
jgi:hypothetical protein